jgi:hypothetical protein
MQQTRIVFGRNSVVTNAEPRSHRLRCSGIHSVELLENVRKEANKGEGRYAFTYSNCTSNDRRWSCFFGFRSPTAIYLVATLLLVTFDSPSIYVVPYALLEQDTTTNHGRLSSPLLFFLHETEGSPGEPHKWIESEFRQNLSGTPHRPRACSRIFLLSEQDHTHGNDMASSVSDFGKILTRTPHPLMVYEVDCLLSGSLIQWLLGGTLRYDTPRQQTSVPLYVNLVALTPVKLSGDSIPGPLSIFESVA